MDGNSSVRSVFTLELNCRIIPGLVTIGKYDGTHPCLTAATSADKVLIHSPHRKSSASALGGRITWSESNREIATLGINQRVTALCAGALLPQEERDILLVGTSTHLLAYHVYDNRDILYKECPDGVLAIVLGTFAGTSAAILVGGNSAIHGYDAAGAETFWVAIGDVVTALILLDYDADGGNELVAGAADGTIRVFKGAHVIGEHAESDKVTALIAVSECRFAYVVANGTVGVYEQEMRLWRVKSKNAAICVRAYDLLGQGDPQLITGWSNGKLDCRSLRSGEVLLRDCLSNGCAGLVEGDYRSVGRADLICASVEGEVRGYATAKASSLTAPHAASRDQETVRELLAQKQLLSMELKHYANNNRDRRADSLDEDNAIPANTRLQIAIATNHAGVQIHITTNNRTVIRAAIVFAEGIFKGEAHVVHPAKARQTTELRVRLRPPKDVPVDIHLKALVGYPTSSQFHVFEVTRQLPRFAMYALVDNKALMATGCVRFKVSERLQRICMWVNQNFLLTKAAEVDGASDLRLHLRSLRDNADLQMHFEVSGRVHFYTDNLALAADLVQSLAAFCNIDLLEANASFPKEEQQLRELFEKLAAIQEARLRLVTDVADQLAQIRDLIVRAEDCRINALDQVARYYNELISINRNLISGYHIRVANYEEGVDTMKTINFVLQKATRLRVGSKSANMIGFCRTAINNSNTDGIIKIFRTGEL